MEQFYYPETIKSITTALLEMFSGIVIRKYESSSIYTSAADKPYISQFNVPLMFGPIEKAYLERTAEHYVDVDNNEYGQRFYMV